MDDNSLQIQIDALNTKMDLILECVNAQKQNSVAINDLVADLSIIGKDMYHSAVNELDNHSIPFDTDEIKILLFGLLKNIKNFNSLLRSMESMMDLAKDAGPIANEIIIDFIHKLEEFNQKGYFEFFGQVGKIVDNIVSHYSPEDVKQLADNVVIILETVRSITQPEMLKSINNAVKIYGSIEMQNIPEYSLWGMAKELRSPEMRRGLGFMITFLKNLSQNNK